MCNEVYEEMVRGDIAMKAITKVKLIKEGLIVEHAHEVWVRYKIRPDTTRQALVYLVYIRTCN